MDTIKKNDKVILGNVSGVITEVGDNNFKIKFDTHKIDGESEHIYPNTLINSLKTVKDAKPVRRKL